jgi:hypothetical protein
MRISVPVGDGQCYGDPVDLVLVAQVEQPEAEQRLCGQ